MKVVWVIRPAEGGILQHLDHLLSGFGDKFQIAVCGPQSLAKWAGNHQFYPIYLNDRLDPWHDIWGLFQLSTIFHREKPQLIHVHGLKSMMLALPAARLQGIRNVLFTAHNCLPRQDSPWYKITRGLFCRSLLRSLRRVIAVSNGVRSEYAKYVPDHKIVTIYNGVDHQRFARAGGDRQLKGLHNAPRYTIGTVARQIPDKGITVLLQAAFLLKPIQPNIEFVIVGDGPSWEQFKTYSNALGLDSVVNFTGYRTDVDQLLSRWDVYVLPSLSEGFSISILEAMAARLPIVVSDLPSTREMIHHGQGGYLVAPGDAPALAGAILSIIRDCPKAQKMGDYNYQRVISCFTVEKMIQRTEEQYNLLMQEDRHGKL